MDCRIAPGGGLGPGGNVSGPLPTTMETLPVQPTMFSIGTIVYSKYLTLDLQLIFLPTESMLDIKVLDDPTKVADIEKEVLDFLKLPDNPQNRNAISIIHVEYAIICAK